MAMNPIIPAAMAQEKPSYPNIISTILEYKEIFAAILFFLFFLHWKRNRYSLFTDWPIFRMLPSLLFNLWQINDYVTQALKRHGGTGEVIAPWVTKRKVVLTCDPMNVLHITSKNFSNYDKGPIFREIFRVLGKGILSDAEEWKHSRELLHSLFRQRSFGLFLDKIVKNKVEGCLFPFLDRHAEKEGTEVDLQDVFNRFMFDNACCMVLGFDPKCLSLDLPQVVYEKFFSEAQVALFHRCVVPGALWRLQKWLGMGKERKMSETQKISELFLHEFVRCKLKQSECHMITEGSGFPAAANMVSREQLNESIDTPCNPSNCSREATSAATSPVMDETEFELLSAMVKKEQKNGKVDEKLIRDNVINVLSAGKDTLTAGLTWFFWLVATHPSVESKILQEMKENFPEGEERRMVLGAEQVGKLVYLHAAICETMRLFPPIPFTQRHAIKSDILPSGHRIAEDTIIIFSSYAMGRLEEVWGGDCLEYKPQRWISDKGGIIHVPSYKYVTFNAGPRTCLGKDMSFTEMKMVASAVLWNYHVQVVEGHPIYPSLSIGFFMKHGLKVRVTRRRSNEPTFDKTRLSVSPSY